MTKRRETQPEEPTFDRPLPHNLEAERSVLGAILIQNDAYLRLGDRLRGEHFYRDAHRRIWKAMAKVIDRGEGCDFITVKNELARTGELDDVGGPAYIAALTDGLPHASNIEYYGGIVRELFLLREIIFAMNKTIAAAYERELTSTEILKAADAALLNVAMEGDRRGMVEMKDRAMELFNDLEELVSKKGQLLGLETGFKSVNDQTQGWQPGDLIIIAARPSVGKTAFALNSAIVPCGTGKHVAFFSLEMRKKQLERRMLSFLSGVPLSKIQSGYLADHDYTRISAALSIIADLPLYVNDRGGQTVGDIRMACRRLKNEKALDLVVVDYVQLIPGSLDRRGANRTEELTDISHRLKWLADEMNVPVVVLSQLKRIGGARPTLEDLRESGSLEQDADVVCLLHRKNHKESGTTNFIIEKQRNGPTGTVNLTLDRDIQLFTDGGQETEEQKATATEEEKQAARTRSIIRNRSRSR